MHAIAIVVNQAVEGEPFTAKESMLWRNSWRRIASS